MSGNDAGAQSQSQNGFGFSIQYLKTLPGMLKIGELLSGIAVFISAIAGHHYSGRGWVSFVGISAFLTTLALLFFHLFNIIGKHGRFRYRFIIPEFIYTGICCALFVSAAIIGAANASDNAGAAAGAFFSFLGAAVYAVDTFWQFRIFKAEREQDNTMEANNSTRTEPQMRQDLPPKYQP